MNTPELTTDQYHAGTPARARVVADVMTDDDWLDVVTSGPMVLFPTIAGEPSARYRVAEVARRFGVRGELLDTEQPVGS